MIKVWNSKNKLKLSNSNLRLNIFFSMMKINGRKLVKRRSDVVEEAPHPYLCIYIILHWSVAVSLSRALHSRRDTAGHCHCPVATGTFQNQLPLLDSSTSSTTMPIFSTNFHFYFPLPLPISLFSLFFFLWRPFFLPLSLSSLQFSPRSPLLGLRRSESNIFRGFLRFRIARECLRMSKLLQLVEFFVGFFLLISLALTFRLFLRYLADFLYKFQCYLFDWWKKYRLQSSLLERFWFVFLGTQTFRKMKELLYI